MKSNVFSPGEGTSTQRLWLLAICAACVLFLFWAQGIHVPYWQDDYYFLLDARKAILEGHSWLAPFFPATKVPFWRPLGMETYWRFIETFLGANAVSAHIANIVLVIAAAAAVGWFAATFAKLASPETEPLPAAITAGFLYGIHTSHFLPAVWVASANDSIAVLFAALTLRFWLVVATSPGKRMIGAGAAVALCFIMALLSRDIAFVVPLLGLLLVRWLWPQYKPTAAAWGVGALCIGIALAWLAARNHFTMTVDPAYKMTFGANVFRNAGCLVLFFFQYPIRSPSLFLLRQGIR